MNENILVMIEAQGLWDKIVEKRIDVERFGKSILHWRDRSRDAKKNLEKAASELKALSVSIKGLEIELEQRDTLVKNLEEKKMTVKTSKELSALEKELGAINEERGSIEEELILKLDDELESKKKFEELSAESEETDSRSAEDIVMLENKIMECNSIIEELEKNFNTCIGSFPNDLRSKFKKILTAKGNRAIAALEGDSCGVCHTSIPVHIVLEASKNEKLMNCTNCGRYIYRASS